MRAKLSILAALVAVGAIGAGIGAAQGAAGGGNSASAHTAVRPNITPTHASAQVLYAVVGRMGALNRGLGVASAGIDHGNTGQYHVLFKRGVRKCAYVATIGTTGSTGGPPAGEIGVVGLNGYKTGVYVETFDSNGNPAYEPFHLVVTCPPL